jgi:ABC-type nitrate/sulfonate/bicarbonate transport system permease component
MTTYLSSARRTIAGLALALFLAGITAGVCHDIKPVTTASVQPSCVCHDI